jgi:hypothetical protein
MSLKRSFATFASDTYYYDNSMRKSGKWTIEEELYASRLIRAFESGNLEDCEEGTTLRAYLTKKLNCTPMRISKKYAGQGIGKVSAIYQYIEYPPLTAKSTIVNIYKAYPRFQITFKYCTKIAIACIKRIW